MKKIYKTINIIILLAITFVSCEKEDNILEIKGENNYSYNQSLNTWHQLKSSHGNSYTYETSTGSWAGYGSATTLEIENGIIISRTYQRYQIDESNGDKINIDSYTETTEDLGSHDYGASLLTFDEIYDICAEEYLTVDKKNNTIYFETTENGILELCGYVPNNCMDDCFTGVRISAFNWKD